MTEQDIAKLLSAIPLPAACISSGGTLAVFNPQFGTLFSSAEPGRSFVLAVRQPAILAAVERSIFAGEAQSVVVEIGDGLRHVNWQVTASPVRFDQQSWSILAFEDRSALEASEQIRREFVANVSHELRSPLTAVLGFIETLKLRGSEDPEIRNRFLNIMQDEARRMSRLVRDLLSLSHVESEERLRPSGRIEVVGIVESVIDVFQGQAKEAGVTFDRTGLATPFGIHGDPDQIRQVFVNLLENAVKYGAAGGTIRVSATRVDLDYIIGGPAVRIDVADNGDGFDPIHIPRLTERFYRIDQHRSRAMGGTGLGLAIVKHIVSRHRGRIKIGSTPGEGSRFSIFLPIE